MGHPIPLWFEVVSLLVMVGIVVGDLLLVSRRPHVPRTRECVAWIGVYVALALVFAGILLVVSGAATSEEFVAGWLTEYSLSVDNLFVFALIMTSFTVPPKQQQKVLMAGIVIALVLRGIVIVTGAALIENFAWTFYLFGAFLVYTGITLAARSQEPEEFRENALLRVVRKFLPVTSDYDGGRLRTTADDGRRLFTPMVIVFVAIGTTDVLFALDSIPAVFGLTENAFIVFAANVFALMGLRQLYFVLNSLLTRLTYLPWGLAAVLVFIGAKLLLEALSENTLPFINHGNPVAGVPTITTGMSLMVIIVSLGTAALASLWHDRRSARRGSR